MDRLQFAQRRVRFVASKTHPDHIVPLHGKLLRSLRTAPTHRSRSVMYFPVRRSANGQCQIMPSLAALRIMGFPRM